MSAFRSLLGFGLAAIASIAAGQVDTTTPPRQSVPVVVANRTIIVLRGPLAGYSARERVNGVTQRIQSALESETPPQVSTVDIEDGTQVLLGGTLAFLVTRIDVDPQLGETTRNVAREAAKRLESAVLVYREQHTPQYLLMQSGWVALATGIYIGLLWLLFTINRWAGHRVGSSPARAQRRCTCTA
ncbi:MAG TPA: hypothetical protein VGK37_13710 [Casimicrobiaceae bacterium]|jgi:hypothetical protein